MAYVKKIRTENEKEMKYLSGGIAAAEGRLSKLRDKGMEVLTERIEPLLAAMRTNGATTDAAVLAEVHDEIKAILRRVDKEADWALHLKERIEHLTGETAATAQTALPLTGEEGNAGEEGNTVSVSPAQAGDERRRGRKAAQEAQVETVAA